MSNLEQVHADYPWTRYVNQDRLKEAIEAGWFEPEDTDDDMMAGEFDQRVAAGTPTEAYIAVDATCPSCGHPERRARFDEHGAVFSCRRCSYVSREREG